MIFYWLLFGFVVIWSCLIAVQDFDSLGHTNVLRISTRLVLIAVVSLFVGLFSQIGSLDYDNYVEMLSEAPPSTLYDLMVLKDPFFQLLGFLFRSADGHLISLTFITTLISFGLKIKVLSNKYYDNLLGLAVIFIFARFFLLHEFTQIRAALGIALISLAIVYAMENKLVLMMLAIILALLTHLSVVALLPAVVLAYPVKIRIKLMTFAFLVFALTAVFLVFKPESFSRLAPYLTGEYHVTENTLFSSYFFFKLVVFIALFLQWQQLSTAMQLAFSISGYGMLLTLVFLKNNVLSLRLGELTAVFDCLCFAWFFRYGLKLNFFYGYVSGIIIAGFLYYSSTKIVNPLALNF